MVLNTAKQEPMYGRNITNIHNIKDNFNWGKYVVKVF